MYQLVISYHKKKIQKNVVLWGGIRDEVTSIAPRTQSKPEDIPLKAYLDAAWCHFHVLSCLQKKQNIQYKKYC
jgi:hypothetical protein